MKVKTVSERHGRGNDWGDDCGAVWQQRRAVADSQAAASAGMNTTVLNLKWSSVPYTYDAL